MKEKKQKIGIHKLYEEDPIKADDILWGRLSNPSTRRGFVKQSALLAINMALGARMVYAQHFPQGMIPAGLAFSDFPFTLPGKSPDLVILNDKPVNAETPPHLLDEDLTPNTMFFVRNNGLPPEAVDTDTWTLTIEGESAQKKVVLTLAELKNKFSHYNYALTLECGGNGRKEFNPPAKGNQWSTGAVGCAKWTGVRLRDVLNYAGIKSDAVYIGYYGADIHLSRDPKKEVISRGVPMAKALEDESLIAWSMNDEALPMLNGYPLRLVFGGWPASCSGKWLNRIVIRNKIHDGEKMGGQSYRIPCSPVAPGAKVEDADMCIIESMPVKSLISYPKTGATIKRGQTLDIRGHAWAGDLAVSSVDYSIDFGISWHSCKLKAPINRLAWQRFAAEIDFPQKGYYEVWAKATDSEGRSQPMLLPGWNPKGYLNNACHRIAVKVI